MSTQQQVRDSIRLRAGSLCLIGVLVATYLHTTSFMAQFFYGSLILGGIAALAVDAGVVAMSIYKDQLISGGGLAWMVRVVTFCVLSASGIANVSEGFLSAYGVPLTWDGLMQTDWLVIVQWWAGTAIFPLLVFVMGDTIGERMMVEYKKESGELDFHFFEHPDPELAAADDSPQNDAQLQRGRKTISANKAYRVDQLEEFLRDRKDATVQDMADFLGVAKGTASKYMHELADTGRIERSEIAAFSRTH